MMFARIAVKMVKPAGVKNFKVVLLRELDYSRGPRPGQSEFHSFIRSKIESCVVAARSVQFAAREAVDIRLRAARKRRYKDTGRDDATGRSRRGAGEDQP